MGREKINSDPTPSLLITDAKIWMATTKAKLTFYGIVEGEILLSFLLLTTSEACGVPLQAASQ